MNRIKELCHENKITLKILGHDLNIAPNTLSNYSTQSRSLPIDVAYSIAKYFNVSMEYVCGYKSDSEHSSLPLQRELDSVLKEMAQFRVEKINSQIINDLTDKSHPYIDFRFCQKYVAVICDKLGDMKNVVKIVRQGEKYESN